MIYLSLKYYLFIIILLATYYLFPLKNRWIVLLAGSIGFYFRIAADEFWIFFITVIVSYFLGLLIYQYKQQETKSKQGLIIVKDILIIAIIVTLIPLLTVKNGNFILKNWLHKKPISWIVPLGISFYTLQIISYYVDIYKGIIKPQKNFLKYTLFISFFPQIIQGPIPKYKQIENQLFEGHLFNEHIFSKGCQLIIWGFFLKLMIADKAAVIVNTVFEDFNQYKGFYILVAGCLYSVQLYADFLACVTISQGVASLFGIHIIDNFNHPYRAISIKDFWRR